MNSTCSHESVNQIPFNPAAGSEEVCRHRQTCPTCGAAVEVEYIKTLPMVDDVELSPRWEPRSIRDLPTPAKATTGR